MPGGETVLSRAREMPSFPLLSPSAPGAPLPLPSLPALSRAVRNGNSEPWAPPPAPPPPSPTSALPSAPTASLGSLPRLLQSLGLLAFPNTGEGQQECREPSAAPRRSPRVTVTRRLRSAEPCFSSLGVVVGGVITDYYHLQNSQCTDMEAGVSMRGNRALVTQLSFHCRLPLDSQCPLTVMVTSSWASSSVLACVSGLSRVCGLQCRKNPARGRGTGRAEAC